MIIVIPSEEIMKHLLVSCKPIFLFVVIGMANMGMILAQAPVSSSETERAWVTPEVLAPRVSFRTFDSAAAKTKVSYHIYKPVIYDQNPQMRFPVVYWLHGSGGGLPGIPRVADLFDRAIDAGKTPPCLVVFVNGLAEGMYVDWKDGSAPIETIIIKDLIPHIDRAYRTIPTHVGRLLDGYSMGGYGAARLGFKYPEMFHAISIMGGGPLQAELVQGPRVGRMRAAEVLQKVYGGDQEYFKSVSPRHISEQNVKEIKKNSLIRLICGDEDETFGNNRAFHEHLEKLEIPHSWIVLKGIEHNPLRTLEALGDTNWQFYCRAFAQTKGVPSPSRKSDQVINFNVNQQDRRALIVNASTDGTKRPAVIVLHGGQGSADIMRDNSGFDAVAKANHFMVVYAEGTDLGNKRHAWNTGFLLRRQVRDADDISYFDILIDKLINDYNADRSRIFMTGGSNGGMMTFVYGVARSERLAAIAPVVASMFTFEKKPAVPLPILIINGGKDEEVPLEGGMSRNPLVRRAQDAPYKPLKDVVQFWVETNKSKIPGQVETNGTLTSTFHASTPGGSETEFILDMIGGHGWPGSTSRRPGNIPINSFSGAERVWKFFKDKQRVMP